MSFVFVLPTGSFPPIASSLSVAPDSRHASQAIRISSLNPSLIEHSAMLSRQARAGIAVLAAISLVVLFLHHGGYDLDRYAIVGSQLPPKALNTDFDKTASLTSSNMDEQDIHNTAENRIHPASPTSSSAVQRSPVPTPEHDNSVYDLSSIDWSRYAYVQYVTNEAYLCNALMIFETLHRLGSKADRVMMYPDYMLRDPTMTQSEGTGSSRELLTKASDEYGVILIPIEVQHRDSPDCE